MVQIVDRLGTINVQNGEGEDRTLEQWYANYMHATNKMDSFLLWDNCELDTLDAVLIEKDFQEFDWGIELSQNLCKNCQLLSNVMAPMLPHITEEGPKFRAQYSSCNEFDASYRAGCHLCHLFMNLNPNDLAYSRKVERRLKHLGESSVINIILNKQKSQWQLSLNAPGVSMPMNHRNRLVLCPVEDNSFSSAKLPLSLPVVAQSATEIALKLAREWLAACVGSHGDVCNWNTTHRVPTRLIAVNEVPIRLVELGHSNTRPRYATLSHCWGTLDFVKLNAGSMKAFKIEIPVERLTLTFQDAIHITQQLGIDYLWIDSLCIVQDSAEDWEIESSHMSSVYGGSVINIAAADAANGSEGCFLQLPTSPQKVRLGNTSTVDDYTQKYDVMPPSLYYESTGGTHLGNRAWALQERLLAPRTIHFSKKGIFWECRLTDACDIFPEGLPEAMQSDENYMRTNTLSEVWTMIIDQYASSQITYNNDRLIALSGIARVAQIENNDQYVAGMWRKDIESQLCWNVLFTKAPRTSVYRAPTWSWASLDAHKYARVYYGQLKTNGRNFTLMAHVVEVSLTPSGADPLGNLSSAYLKIACTGLLSGRFDNNKNRWWGGILRSFELLELPGMADNYFLISPDCAEEFPSMIYVLPLVHKRTLEGEIISGLIIAPTAGPKGEFRRYGSFNKEYDSNDQDSKEGFEKLLKVVRENGPATASSVCVGRDSTQSEHVEERFLVTLV